MSGNLAVYGAVLNRPGSASDRYWAATIATRSRQLTAMDKLLYRRILALDIPTSKRPGGCFASIPALAEMLGASERTVKATRARLHRLGLLYRQVDGKGKPRWYAILPGDVSLKPGEKKGDAADSWLRSQTSRLDAALEKGAHLERIRRLKPFSDAPRRSQDASSSEVQNDDLDGAKSRPSEGNMLTGQGQNADPQGAICGPSPASPSTAKRRRGKGLQDKAAALVVDRVCDLVTDEVTHGVGDFRKLALSGAPLTGRAGDVLEAKEGRPGDGGPLPSQNPDDFTGWFEFMALLIEVNGGRPGWFDERAERAAYVNKRALGISHRALLRFTGRGLREVPAVEKLAG